MHGGVLDRALLHLGDAARDGDHDAGTDEPALAVGLLDEVAEHRLGDLEVGDDTIRAAEHSLGLVADGENLGGAGLDGDDGGFAKHDPLVLDEDKSVGGAEIDADVTGEKSEE